MRVHKHTHNRGSLAYYYFGFSQICTASKMQTKFILRFIFISMVCIMHVRKVISVIIVLLQFHFTEEKNKNKYTVQCQEIKKKLT